MAETPNKGEGDRQDPQKNDFLFPRARYRGEFTPERLAFDANLQEFTQRIGIICALETGGKLDSVEAYSQIKGLWKELKASKKQLLEGGDPPEVELPPED